jgi:MSHA pilin protein MshD
MNNKAGFTLIEIVVGIIVLAVSLTIVSSIFLPQANKTITPMYQIKATALGKRIMDQVLIRYYDDAMASTGGYIRCGETIAGVTINCSSKLGLDTGEIRSQPNGFNDVDDYHVYCDDQADYNRTAALGFFTNDYPGYGLRICVALAAQKFGGNDGDNDVAKRVQVTVFMPNSDTITLSSFKGNY